MIDCLTFNPLHKLSRKEQEDLEKTLKKLEKMIAEKRYELMGKEKEAK